MTLWRRGGVDAVAFPGQPEDFSSLPVLGGPDVPFGCEPVFWTDDHTVVCDGDRYHEDTDLTERNYFQVTLSGDYATVTDVRPLLPATDRSIGTAVLSPERDAFVFVSTQGNVEALYRQSLTPDAEPTKLIDLTRAQTLVAWN